MRTCRVCQTEKPLEAFYKHPRAIGGRDTRCGQCSRDRAKAQRAKDPAGQGNARRDRWLRKQYGLTADQYDRLLAEQEGRCAICRRVPTSRRLAVDHDHDTGAVRGLLCGNCNRGIGYLGDSPVTVLAALRYLETAGASP